MKSKINKLIFILFISVVLGQAEFQICSIAENSYMLSNHRGLSAIEIINNNLESNINLNIIYFPSSINYINSIYKKYSLSILDYGKITDQIDNNIINTFSAYEMEFKYHYQKKKKNIIINANGGLLYSQISKYNSTALIADLKILFSKKNQMGISLNNIGIIIDSYTHTSQNLPFEVQFGVANNLTNTNIIWGYDILYRNNIKKIEHIFCVNIPIKKEINLRFSWSNFRKKLLTDTAITDWFYGLGAGIGIKTNNIFADIGISSIGSSGLIYGISFSYITN